MMATQMVSLSDEHIRRSRSLEKKAWFMGRFVISSLARLSFDSILKHLDIRKEVQTILRLSDKGLSWGEQSFSWRRPWKRTVPFGFVELAALREVFQENSQPQVLICVVSLVPGTSDFNYHVFAFRLYDVEDVRRFQVLFQFLTNAGGLDKDTNVKLNSEENSHKARLAVRPSLEENKAGRSFGDRIRHAPKKKDRKPAIFFDPNNNIENADQKDNDYQMFRPFSDSDSPDGPPATNRRKYHSLQPIGRKNATPETRRSLKHSIILETVPAAMATGVKTENGCSIQVKGRNKITSKSWSDDEGERGTERNFTWTRNILFSDKDGSHRDALGPNLAAEDYGSPKAHPRSSAQERTITPTQMKSESTPERTITPTEMMAEIYLERTITPTQMKSDITPERTITPTEMMGEIYLERTITPTHIMGPTSQNVEMTSLEGPDGMVRVYVPEFQSPVAVVPKKSLLKSRKDLDHEGETTAVDSERPKKSLSFNPSVLVNGTVGNAFDKTGSPDQPDMTVTIHRVFRHRPASWSESSNTQRPENLSSARSRVMLRGLSLPDGNSASFVASKTDSKRSAADYTTANSKPHARIKDHHQRVAKHDHETIDERKQMSGEFHKERVERIGSIPVDVITEEEDRGYDRSPRMTQSTTSAATGKLPQQPKGIKTGAATPRGHHRMAFIGKRYSEPPLLYASDSEESSRSRSASRILVGHSKRQDDGATQAVHQIKSPDDGDYPSRVVEATVTPNGRLELGGGAKVRKGEAKRTVVLREVVDRGKEIGAAEMERGRSTTVREIRRSEAEDGAKQFSVAVTHDRPSDPVGRSLVSRRSRSVVDPRRLTNNPDLAPPNGHLPDQLMTRSRSASRPILLSRTIPYEDEAARVTVPVGQMAGGQRENGSRKVNRLYLSDQPQTTRLQNGIFWRLQRN